MLDPPQPDKDNVPMAGLLIKNGGQTPAYNVISWAKVAVILRNEENTALPVPPLQNQFANTLGYGASFSKGIWLDRKLGQDEIADIRTGARAIYVYGRIEYKDAFKKRHVTHFRLHYWGQYPPPQNAILSFCESGNDAD